jgi:hemoglobin/transferrin/lactoferrin receptor protein
MAGTIKRSIALLGSASALALLSTSTFSPAHAQVTYLDPITIIASKSEEYAIDALAPVSTVRLDQINQILPSRASQLFITTPGVTFQDRADEPSGSINIRGLQDFGRVAVLIDGARQNSQRTGHFANGMFYLDPEMIGGVDVVRGPTANIYGSGAIGGVVAFRTKEASDILKPNQLWAVETNLGAGSNTGYGQISTFAASRTANGDVIAGISHRDQSNYKDGSGVLVQNSWQQVTSGLLKANFMPADGHKITIGGLFNDSQYNFGQPPRPPLGGTSIYATETQNFTVNARWRYDKPEDRLFNFDGNIYWNRTDTNQLKIAHTTTTNSAYCGGIAPGNNITGCIGDRRGFLLDTLGFDLNNTSRFEFAGWKHAITIGGDFFTDQVSTFDPRGTGDLTTPGGHRNVFGGFLQWKGTYGGLLEFIAAGRYDQYQFSAGGVENDKSRFSPKITVGLFPAQSVTPYGSYAEGYRSPTLTESLVIGAHPTGGGPGAFVCPDGNPGFFCFAQNLNLRPEVGKNKEIGINFKFDNVFQRGDAFRAKVNVFRNDVEDFIELTGYGAFSAVYQTFNFYQYQNISSARIEGVEIESTYDAGNWFAGLSGQHQKGRNQTTNVGLVNVQPDKIVTTFGVRLLDRRLTAMVRWAAVAAQNDLPVNYLATESYNLVNLHVAYKMTDTATLSFNVDNLLNEFYHQYPVVRSTPTDGQNDSLWASAAQGITFKAALKVRFGDGENAFTPAALAAVTPR